MFHKPNLKSFVYPHRLGCVRCFNDESKLQQPLGHPELQHYEWHGQPKLLSGQHHLGRMHGDEL